MLEDFGFTQPIELVAANSSSSACWLVVVELVELVEVACQGVERTDFFAVVCVLR